MISWLDVHPEIDYANVFSRISIKLEISLGKGGGLEKFGINGIVVIMYKRNKGNKSTTIEPKITKLPKRSECIKIIYAC